MPTPSLDRPTRENVTTIRSDGSRPFLFPADARGRFTQLRRYSALGLIGFYLLLPWIKINGYPAAFFDIAERRFHLFGVTFAAQDMWLLFFVITGVGFTLFFVTALLGRVWCGWACPHTVFLDHVYRRIERWIEGDALKRSALHMAPLSAGKIFKRGVKHALFLLVSAAIMHLFLAYFVSIPEVWSMIQAAPADHGGAFAFMAISTAILYFNFAWFREQLCIVLCPYGRLQSALIDDNTMVIGYDAKRGEPRGRRQIAIGKPPAGMAERASVEPGRRDGAFGGRVSTRLPVSGLASETGDCVDCVRCVHVCPTGIDIRQGLQMECIGCTACIDACDDVMIRLGRAPGLIRYDSQAGFAHGLTRWIRPRTVLYFGLFLVGVVVSSWAVSTIKPANFGVTRITGAPYIVDDTTVRNQFLVRVVNKRNAAAKFRLKLDHAPIGSHQVGFELPFEVGPLGEIVQPLILQQARDQYAGPFKFDIEIEDAGGRFHLEREVEFLGPEARLLRDGEKDDHGHH